MKRIALVGDYNDNVVAHGAIPIALRMAADALGTDVSWDWLHSSTLLDPIEAQLQPYAAVWCVPGSPYENTRGIIESIRFARTRSLPFLGTCGGFQHAMMEYAEAVWGVDASHAENSPDAVDPVIAPLLCALVEVKGDLHFEAQSRLRNIYGHNTAHEEYHCSYGFNSLYLHHFDNGPLKIAARDDEGSVRAIELDGHPFFFGTLFQPERAALRGKISPLVRAFVAAMTNST